MDRCAIHITPDSTLHSCLDLDALQRIADAYNKKKKKKVIQFTDATTKWELWEKIRAEMNSICKDDEICWISKSNVDKNIEYERFKPLKPKNKFTWLSNIDIERIMFGRQQKHKDFRFFGAIPSDFDKVITELNGSNLLNMPEIRKAGIVTNLDPHYKSGSHWTAFYLDLNDASIEYFDSLGEPPFKTMENYMKDLRAWLKINMNINAKIKINTREFQKKYDGDCGIWSVWYIIQRLNGLSFEQVVKLNMPEEVINKCRDIYFRIK
jgi:hypothetical protein